MYAWLLCAALDLYVNCILCMTIHVYTFTCVWCLGGEGSTGKIVDVTGWNKNSEVWIIYIHVYFPIKLLSCTLKSYIFTHTDLQRSVVVVRWQNGNKKNYRVGHKGKVSVYTCAHWLIPLPPLSLFLTHTPPSFSLPSLSPSVSPYLSHFLLYISIYVGGCEMCESWCKWSTLLSWTSSGVGYVLYYCHASIQHWVCAKTLSVTFDKESVTSVSVSMWYQVVSLRLLLHMTLFLGTKSDVMWTWIY